MIMVGAHVPTEEAERVRSAILDNKATIIEGILAHEENDKYSGMDFFPVEYEDYNFVRDIYTTAGFPQYDDFIGD